MIKFVTLLGVIIVVLEVVSASFTLEDWWKNFAASIALVFYCTWVVRQEVVKITINNNVQRVQEEN